MSNVDMEFQTQPKKLPTVVWAAQDKVGFVITPAQLAASLSPKDMNLGQTTFRTSVPEDVRREYKNLSKERPGV